MAAENILQTPQRVATIMHRLDQVTQDVQDLRGMVTVRVDRVEAQAADLRERVARLEACREADRAEAQADLARFQAEVERAELRLTRLLPGP